MLSPRADTDSDRAFSSPNGAEHFECNTRWLQRTCRDRRSRLVYSARCHYCCVGCISLIIPRVQWCITVYTYTCMYRCIHIYIYIYICIVLYIYMRVVFVLLYPSRSSVPKAVSLAQPGHLNFWRMLSKHDGALMYRVSIQMLMMKHDWWAWNSNNSGTSAVNWDVHPSTGEVYCCSLCNLIQRRLMLQDWGISRSTIASLALRYKASLLKHVQRWVDISCVTPFLLSNHSMYIHTCIYIYIHMCRYMYMYMYM